MNTRLRTAGIGNGLLLVVKCPHDAEMKKRA